MWPIHEGEKDGVYLWVWLNIKYESAAKLDPLRRYYLEKIRSLKLKTGGLLHNYIDRFQELEILWQDIDTTFPPEYRLVTQMVEQIEDPIFSGPRENINNWSKRKCTFCDAVATLRAHDIGKLAC